MRKSRKAELRTRTGRGASKARIRIYVAGNLAVEAMRRQMEGMTFEFERLGAQVFLPHRDAGIIREEDFQGFEARKNAFKSIFEHDIDELESADYLVCLLDGLSFGTSLELGYAYALKKNEKRGLKVIGLYTDLRGPDSLDLMRTAACDHICTSVADLRALVRNLVRTQQT